MNNFCKNKLKFELFLIFLLLNLLFFNTNNLDAKESEIGLPYIKNYTSKEYGTDPQNFSVTQGKSGLMYFGNMSGILEYDELSWRLIEVPGWPYLTTSDDGKVYVGAFNEFGYLAPNSSGQTSFFSLKDRFLKRTDFDAVFNIASYGGDVFFETDEELFYYHNDVVELLDTNHSRFTVFATDQGVYINHSEYGLSKFENNTIRKLPLGEYFKGKDILDILPHGNSILIKINSLSYFLEYDRKEIKRFSTPADQFLNRYNYSKGVVLRDSTIAFGTTDKGVLILGKNGNVIIHLNKNNGLNDNCVYSLFCDISGNIWAGLRNGISKIEYPSYFTYFSFPTGLHGAVLSIIRYKSQLYVGSLSGAFILNNNHLVDMDDLNSNIKSFSQINDISAIVYQFILFKDQLLAISDHGIYRISGTKAENLYDEPLRCALFSPLHPDLLFIGGLFGFSALQYENGTFKDLGPLSSVRKSIRTMALAKDGDIWLGSNNFGVFRISSAKKYNQAMQVTHFDEDFLLPKNHGWVDVYNTQNGMLFSSESGHLYRFDASTPKFYDDTLIGLGAIEKNRWVFPIYESEVGNLVMSMGSNKTFKKETLVAFINPDGNSYELVNAPFYKISDFTVEAFYSEQSKILWIGGADGLIRFDRNKLQTDSADHSIIIKQITLGNDSIIPLNPMIDYSTKKNYIEIEPYFNSMKFDFVCPAYLGNETMMYKIFLENFDKKWSDWSFSTRKEYNLLRPGKYVFWVKAKNVFGQEYGDAKIEFIILAPFYLTYIAYIIYGIFLIAFLVIFFRYRSYQLSKEKNKLEKIIKERTDELLKEIERAEDLLVNMLPKQIAAELKLKGETSIHKFDLVSVLFTDIQGFTEIAELIDPSVLVHKLEELFLQFDTIVEKYRIEKIKTIGDGYMCAGGIPEKDRTNPIEVILAALEIREYMKRFEFDEDKTSHLNWGLRIGIHSGPAIAGVIGTRRYSYDIWGVTVNSASRMESKGKVGKINISEVTYNLTKEYFDCEYHGISREKAGAELKMYIVNSIKAEYAEDAAGTIPNSKLRFQLFDIRYTDLYDFVIEKLANELPKNLYYHNLQHTIDVCMQVEQIARAEGISDKEIIILKTAALFHDSGFTIGYDNHEIYGVKLAREILPRFQYTREQIEHICSLIMVTKIPPTPKNKLEMIICDADLDYLGRRDFIPISRNLFMELYERKSIKSVDEWLKKQISFIEKHTYFTETAMANRDVNKKQQLENIRQMDFLSSFF